MATLTSNIIYKPTLKQIVKMGDFNNKLKVPIYFTSTPKIMNLTCRLLNLLHKASNLLIAFLSRLFVFLLHLHF